MSSGRRTYTLKPFGGAPRPKPNVPTYEERVVKAKELALGWLRDVYYHDKYVDDHAESMDLLDDDSEVMTDGKIWRYIENHRKEYDELISSQISSHSWTDMVSPIREKREGMVYRFCFSHESIPDIVRGEDTFALWGTGTTGLPTPENIKAGTGFGFGYYVPIGCDPSPMRVIEKEILTHELGISGYDFRCYKDKYELMCQYADEYTQEEIDQEYEAREQRRIAEAERRRKEEEEAELFDILYEENLRREREEEALEYASNLNEVQVEYYDSDLDSDSN